MLSVIGGGKTKNKRQFNHFYFYIVLLKVRIGSPVKYFIKHKRPQRARPTPTTRDTGPPFLYCDSDPPPHLVAFYDTLGIRRTYSRLKPPASSRGSVHFWKFVYIFKRKRKRSDCII